MPVLGHVGKKVAASLHGRVGIPRSAMTGKVERYGFRFATTGRANVAYFGLSWTVKSKAVDRILVSG